VTLPADPLLGLALEPVASGLHQPTVIVAPPGDERLFIVEREGVVRVADANGLRDEPFLDLRDRIGSTGIEQGMLGLAFHPGFADNGRFFGYYVDVDGNRQLSGFTVGSDPEQGDPDSEQVLFELPQPAGSVDIRHYGGNVAFGPDGLLYVSLGDGAAAGDEGQNPDSFYASILRLDVDSGDPYTVPASNPFVGGGGAPEVWVYGLRNPWRFSIDPGEGLMYVADVGQDGWEEVDVLDLGNAGGSNLGWPSMEGTHCYFDEACDPADFVLPVFEYGHDEGCSITGGHVYRGPAIPELHGHYLYADWCDLWVRSFRYSDGEVSDEQDWSSDLPGAGQVNAFGIDGAGELYLANFEGEVFKIVPER
jgi:glucose/arabinose dehydrogenase